MSVTISTQQVSLQQRSAEATKRLKDVLGLTDLKLLATALTEVCIEEAERHPSFANDIREKYAQLEALKGMSAHQRRGRGTSQLVPIATIADAQFDPYAPLDPSFLLRLYGRSQIRAALEVYSRDTLKEASAKIEQRNPGTKPTNRSRKDSIIDYIVEHVAGSGY